MGGYTLNNPLRYTDPSGHVPVLAVVIGFGAGGVIGGVGYVVGSALTQHEMRWDEAAVAVRVGAVSGAMAPVVAVSSATVGVGAAKAVALGTVSNVVQYAATQAVTGEAMTTEGGLVAAKTGATGGLVAGPVSRQSMQALARSAPREMFHHGATIEIDDAFASVAALNFSREQFNTGNLLRATSGATVSNLDLGSNANPGEVTVADLLVTAGFDESQKLSISFVVVDLDAAQGDIPRNPGVLDSEEPVPW